MEEMKLLEDEVFRIDCLLDIIGDENQNKMLCRNRGCIWNRVENKNFVFVCFINDINYGYIFLNELLGYYSKIIYF